VRTNDRQCDAAGGPGSQSIHERGDAVRTANIILRRHTGTPRVTVVAAKLREARLA